MPRRNANANKPTQRRKPSQPRPSSPRRPRGAVTEHGEPVPPSMLIHEPTTTTTTTDKD